MLELVKRALPAGLRASVGRVIRNHRRLRGRDPHCYGLDFVDEVAKRMPHHPIKVVFDVGANIGITALEFSDAFPSAEVYAFEPTEINFRTMAKNLIGKPKIKRFKTALGDQPGKGHIRIDLEHPTTCNIVPSADSSSQPIVFDSIDNFCTRYAIEYIDILKLDVEGYELQVLAGAKEKLHQQAIAMVKAECAVDPDNNWHTKFTDLCDLLLPLGYRLFGIYEQYECWQKCLPPLRRFDAAFVSLRASETRPPAAAQSGG